MTHTGEETLMRKTQLVLALAALGLAGSAFATNGYFSHGYGMKAKGMGGAATAMASDTFGGANNPASMVFVGDRIDMGLEVFSPIREASRTGSAAFGGIYNDSVESDSNYFAIPEFGYNKLISPNLAVGVTVYGNGGMNTDYKDDNGIAGTNFNPAVCGAAAANLLFGCGKLGMDYMQLIIAPTVSYKVNSNHSIGVAPLVGYQRLKVYGLQAFQGFSNSAANVSNNGYDDAFGAGVRVGWMGNITPNITLGAAYSSKVYMGEFDKYRGLLAEQGDLDIPENYNVGIAIRANPKLTVAFDVSRINYSDVKAISNGVTNSLAAPPTNPLGSDNGSGFNWRDQTKYKLGFEYASSDSLTLRGGYNYGKTPIRNGIDDLTFNIIAPGVVEHHLTLGATWTLKNKGELTVAYMHAFSNDVTGASATALPSLLGTPATEKLKMHQNAIGIAYGWKM